MTAALAVFKKIFPLQLEEGLPVADLRQSNPKGRLQEIAQRLAWAELPVYETVSASGPDHAPAYVMRVRVEGGYEAFGEAGTKRAAMVDAARKVLVILKANGIE